MRELVLSIGRWNDAANSSPVEAKNISSRIRGCCEYSVSFSPVELYARKSSPIGAAVKLAQDGAKRSPG